MLGGVHFIADFENCTCGEHLLLKPYIAETLIKNIVSENNFTILNSNFQSIGPNFGYTGVITLLESHISIHTWPERNFINLDVYTCNYSTNNYEKTQNMYTQLCDLFSPKAQNLKIIGRKNIVNIPNIDYSTWGYHLILNLYKCNDAIKSEESIKEYVTKLCNLIEMKRYGNCECVEFGEDPKVTGYSMFQLIETSNIAGHFVNINNNAFLDIFSCKKYNVLDAINFSINFFNAQDYLFNYIER